MKLRHLVALALLPLLALTGRSASTPINNGIMTGTLAFNQVSTSGFVPWANIGLTAGALPGVNSITAVGGSTLTLTTGALGIQINANGSLQFPYNAVAGIFQSDGSGNVTTVANGVNGTVLSMVLGTPTWALNATGNVSNSGTPTAGQLAQWVDATHIQGVTAINPTSIGATTPGTGAFTTLSASSTVSGAGFSTYLASPPAIGGTSPAAGAFTTLSASSTSSFTGVMTISSAVSWGSGVRQTFAPNGTTPGFNVGSNAGDPASPSNGDMWYDSTGNALRVRINGSSVSLGSSGVSSITGTAGQVLANGTSGSAQVNAVTMTLAAGLTGINSITAAASNSMTLTAGSGGNFNIVLAPTGSGNVQDSSTTASSSTTTGAFVDSGGMGVAGSIWAGSIQGTPVGSTTQSTGAFTFLGVGTTSVGAGNILIYSAGTITASGGGVDIMELATTETAAANADALNGFYMFQTIAEAAKTGLTVNGINLATPSLGGGGSVTGGYMINVAAPAAGMSGALNITSGTSAFGGLVTMAAGVTASGATSFDWSGSSGTFKTSTGAVTIGGAMTATAGANTFSNSTFQGGGASIALTVTQTARTSGVLPYVKFNIPADTGITASTEGAGFWSNTGTRTWATTGTVALQRENRWDGPTYASASASQTFTDVFTGYMTPPIAGSNAIFTRDHTFGIVDATSAASSITGGFIVATTLGTTATSVGIGGGNINAGGTGTFGGVVTSIQFQTGASQSSLPNGSISFNSGNGVTIIGKTGSTYDASMTNNAGTVVFGVLTGTSNGFVGGTLTVTTPAINDSSTKAATTAYVSPATSTPTESAGAVTFDGSVARTFSVTLNANLTTVTLSNLIDGQPYVFALTNTASNYTVTWGNSIKWVGGSQPTQTIGAHTDVWTLVKIGTTLYGNAVQNF